MNKWNGGSIRPGSPKLCLQMAGPQRNARTARVVELDAGVLSYFEIVAGEDIALARPQQVLPENTCEANSISNDTKSVRALQTNVSRT